MYNKRLQYKYKQNRHARMLPALYYHRNFVTSHIQSSYIENGLYNKILSLCFPVCATRLKAVELGRHACILQEV